ncbi:MAG: two-component regulator propeller domain-containing protein [Thermoanaerobaculia bacterium]
MISAISAIALAGPRAAAAQRLPFTVYSTDEGLAASQVWHVLQDRRGYLWVSTTWGLCRWDGVSFGTLSIPDGLPSATARVTVEATDGTLWIGTNGGIASYDGERITSYADRGGALGATIWSAGLDRHGALWFGSDHGLVSYDGREFRTFLRADGLADDYVYSLLPASDGALWLGSRGQGVTRCTLEPAGRLGSCRVFTTADGLANDSVRAIVEDKSGGLFFATRGGGLSRFDGKRFTRLTVADGLPADDLYALLLTRDGREIIVGSTAGVGLCPLPDAHPCRLLRESNGLADNEVHSLLEDREGSLWIGSEGGISRLVRKDLWSYGEAEGLPDRQVFALVSDGNGGIWAGTVNGLGHLTFGPDGEPTARIWRKADGLPDNWVWALLRSHRGELWVGSEEGLSRLLPAGGFETLDTTDGLAANYVVSLFEDSSGAIWVGSIDGLTRLRFDASGRRSEIRTFGKADGLVTDRAYAVIEDADGRIFVAHGEGLSYLDGERFRQVGKESGLDTGSVRALGRTSDGTLWIGGYARLARLASEPGKGPPRFAPYTSGLADTLVLTISDDRQGRLLLGTNHGVLSFDPAARGGLGAVQARFDRATGTIASEVSHSSAFTRDTAGRFWFGFKGGVTAFPADLGQARPPDPPPVQFERLATRSGREWRAPFSGRFRTIEPLLGAEPIVLAHQDSNLRVDVRAVTLSGEAQLRFQFQLVGFESTWSEPQSEAFRDYTNLDPGQYRLEARTALGSGPWSAPIALALEVSPAWYQRRLVTLLLTLGVITAVFAAATFRTRRIRARNRALEKDVSERTDDLARYARALEEHAHALDRANERIRLADRHRSEFLAKMSHELRTPLTSVLGFAALLADGLGGELEPRHARYLENIRESGNQLLRLINNLLDQAKIEAGRMDLQLEPASLETIIESALAMMEGYGSTRGVHLKATFSGQAPAIVVDVAKLRQAVLNLLSNAIKFSSKGGEVEVRIRFAAASDSSLGVDTYEIIVADQGPGIEPADQERIFEPFQQLATRGETVPGTGLGLAITRQFVALLGGVLEVESAVGEGAAFRILLPVDATVRAKGLGEPAALRESGSGDRPRVVVLEPDRGRFTMVAGDLERQGFLAVRAPDSEEGRRMVRELRPAVVAVDIFPARLEAWANLLALEPDLSRAGTPLVLFAFASGSERGVAASFERILLAPASGGELVAALRLATPASRLPPPSGPIAAPGRRQVWLASAERNAPPELDGELAEAGFAPHRPPTRSRAQAQAAGGGFDAIAVDLADRHAGGFELAVELQAGRATGMTWIALAPGELTSSERKRLVEYVDGAAGSAGAAVAAAAIRVTKGAPGVERRLRDDE